MTNPSTYLRRRMVSPCFICGFLALALLIVCTESIAAGLPSGRAHDGRHQIDQLEEVWRVSVLKTDTAAMATLLADDYMGITANGTLQTKDQVLENMRSGRIHLTDLTVSDRKVRFYGKTAVVTSFAHVEGANLDGEINGNFRYTRVYVKNSQGEWKIVSFEASRIRPAPAHR